MPLVGLPKSGSRVIDPSALTEAQRYGDACVSCHKRWPRPNVLAGILPDMTPVFACEDCPDSPDLNGDHR